jgi:hypothetical protein
MRQRPNSRKRFVWTSEFDAALVSGYRRAHNRQELSQSLTALQLRTGFTRVVILDRAVRLGLSFSRRRPWTPEESALLASLAGRHTLASIARKLKRTFASVKGKAKQLEISIRVSEGYSQIDLAELLGASPTSIRRWCRIGWLRVVNERIPEAAVVKFLKLHSHEYKLSRVDEAWFKGLLFPAFNSANARADGSRERGPDYVGYATQATGQTMAGA